MIDLLQYSGDSGPLGISEMINREYSHLSENPLKGSKLTQDGKIKTLTTRVNSLPNKTELLAQHAKPAPSMDALSINRAPFGATKHSPMQKKEYWSILLLEKKHPRETPVFCWPRKVSWDNLHPNILLGGATSDDWW